jgi:hypothetical protein
MRYACIPIGKKVMRSKMGSEVQILLMVLIAGEPTLRAGGANAKRAVRESV